MEDCARMQELISRMLDEQLDRDEQAALAKHLESCPACRSVYTAFSAVSEALGGELEEPPESLRENVMAEIRRGEIRKKNSRGWRAVLSAAAVIALVLGLRFGLAPRVESTAVRASVKGFAPAEESAPAEEAAFEAAVYEAAESEESAAEEAYAAQEDSAVIYGAVAEKNNAAAEAPAAAAGAVLTEDAALNAASRSAADPGADVEVENIDLSQMSYTELLEKLDGEKTELRLEELPIRRSAVILCADSWLTLFEYEGSWYYHVAADPAPRRSRLDPDALRALAGK